MQSGERIGISNEQAGTLCRGLGKERQRGQNRRCGQRRQEVASSHCQAAARGVGHVSEAIGWEANEEKGKSKRWPFNCPINTEICSNKGLVFCGHVKPAPFLFILFSFFPRDTVSV